MGDVRMKEKNTKHAHISIRPTHGTARVVNIQSVVPEKKSEKEVFWVNALKSKLPDLSDFEIQANEDDSHGNHDVIAKSDNLEIGIQVTELTSELRKKHENIRTHYLNRIVRSIGQRNIQKDGRILVNLLFKNHLTIRNRPQSEDIVDFIENLSSSDIGKRINCGIYDICTQNIGSGAFYVPNCNNIGIDVNFDQVPRTEETYINALEYLARRKRNSKSPWLLIWSLDFWKDKRWLGGSITNHLTDNFHASNFERVYFLESLDGEGFFQANLTLHRVKS